MTRNLRGVLAFLLCCFALVLGSGLAAADNAGPNDDQQIAKWQDRIGKAEAALGQSQPLASDKLDGLQAEMFSILTGARQMKDKGQRQLAPLKSQLSSLGPPPAADAAPEDPAVAKLRQRLQDDLAQTNGRIQQSDLLIVRAQNVLSSIGLQQQQKMQQRLFQRGPSPLSPVIWASAIEISIDAFKELIRSPADWWQQSEDLESDQATLIVIGITLFLTVIIAFPLRRWIMNHWAPRSGEQTPKHTRRIVAAGAVGLAQVILPVVALIAVSKVLQLMVPPDQTIFFVNFIASAAVSLVLFTVIVGLATAAFAPRHPQWSLIPLPDGSARKIVNRITMIAGTFAIANIAHNAAGRGGEPPANYTAFESMIVTILVSVSLLDLLRARYWRLPDQPQRPISLILRAILTLVAIATPVAALAGYPEMSRYLMGSLLITVMVIGITLLARAVIHEGVTSLFLPGGRLNRYLSGLTPMAADSAKRMAFWARLLIDFLLWPPVIYGLLISYGLQASLLNVWVGQALTGVKIGGVKLSLIDILSSLIALVIGFLIVGWVKHWVNDRVLPNTRLDIGMRNSIATCVGYVGGIIVVIIAIMMLGIDLSNIALVAGALSVGIGFGLKTVVENFVSGILLLIERPVKAGDWISVGGTEGIVKSISVRATEIETFDKASIILPNSELIANPVTNWTHKNRIARILIHVGVDYNVNTRQVHDILIACAKAHSRVMSIPPPSVLFKSFGESALNFELRCFVADTDDYSIVKSDLHFAIDDAFRQDGINIPYPLREVIVRHMPEQAQVVGKISVPREIQEVKPRDVDGRLAGRPSLRE